ncbi:hypothetical protein [Streptomyces sp. URMC 123]|uniref:hypothetical protein n=1 Tax=Streptomyces sp. URMC 123 TaxID=3423403 RepID=UPI003F1C868D
MTTQTDHKEQTTTAASTPQGSHHWVMTVEIPGRVTFTEYGTWTPPAGATRHDAFMSIKKHMAVDHPELANANVMYFALERNEL